MRSYLCVCSQSNRGPAGPTWTGLNSLPATVIGDVSAVNIHTTATARMPTPPTSDRRAARNGRETADTAADYQLPPQDTPAAERAYAFAALCGRIASSQHPYDPDHGGDLPGDCLNLTSTGEWKLTQGAPVHSHSVGFFERKEPL